MTRKMLLADDSITIQKVVELTFSDEDFQIVMVGDGATAFEKIRIERPDIILSDVIMPGLNGYEFCQKVKSDPELKEIPFLFLKGTFESFDEEKANQCGADGFIVKPFESQELINRVKELTERAQPATAPVSANIPSPAPTSAPPTATPPHPAAAAPPLSTPSPSSETVTPPSAPVLEEAFDLPPPPPPEEEVLFEEVMEEDSAAPEDHAESEDDLWSEVSLSEQSSPVIEDKALEEDSFWGTEPAAGADSIPVAEVAGTEDESLQDAVEETVGLDLEGEAGTTTPADIPSLVAAETQPVAEPTPPEETRTEPIAAASRDKLERVVAGKIENTIREIMTPLIGDVARKVIEEVAWEVVPDLAEAMIRKELDEIKSRSGSGGSSGP
jgi:CheY-like chemotaxis protein